MGGRGGRGGGGHTLQEDITAISKSEISRNKARMELIRICLQPFTKL